MKIVIFGHVCIDKNTSEQSSYVAPGGPAMFMQKIYQQFPDCEVAIVAPYGPDYLPFLQGVNILPDQPIAKATLQFENTSKQGTRTQKSYHQTELPEVTLTAEIIAKIKQADLIFFAPLLAQFSAQYIAAICAHAPETAYKVLLPQGYYRTVAADHTINLREFVEANQVLSHVDVVIVSEQDHVQMLSQAESWANEYGITSLVTLGENGAVAFTQGKKQLLPTLPVAADQVVDSVGAGDIFSAGFAYQFVKTHSLAKAGAFANAVARASLFFTTDEIKIDFAQLENS